MKKKLLKILKITILSVVIVVTLVISLTYFILNEELPTGERGKVADDFALKVLEAVQHDTYVKTEHLQWTFRNQHHYTWDRNQNIVLVQWEDYEILLDLNNHSKSYVKKPSNIAEKEKQKLLNKALDFFNNDSFWVVAPHKLFDKGTTRQLIPLDNDQKGLLVTYASGGSTPGDSYLWKVDKNYLPTSYKMWVSIIPIGGLEATWEDWMTTESGAYLSQTHKLLGLEIPISNMRAWNN